MQNAIARRLPGLAASLTCLAAAIAGPARPGRSCNGLPFELGPSLCSMAHREALVEGLPVTLPGALFGHPIPRGRSGVVLDGLASHSERGLRVRFRVVEDFLDGLA